MAIRQALIIILLTVFSILRAVSAILQAIFAILQAISAILRAVFSALRAISAILQATMGHTESIRLPILTAAYLFAILPFVRAMPSEELGAIWGPKTCTSSSFCATPTAKTVNIYKNNDHDCGSIEQFY